MLYAAPPSRCAFIEALGYLVSLHTATLLSKQLDI
jgi:hypothetical protein